MPFNFHQTDLEDVILIKPVVFKDERGSFEEVFKFADFSHAGLELRVKQVNSAISHKNVLRGLHYQTKPKAMSKLIRCVSGEIFDVAVDIRKGSPSYGKWVGCQLSSENRNMLFIPKGFAHGFCVLSDHAEVMYYCDNVYSPEHDTGIAWNDPEIDVDWPIDEPILSQRDKSLPSLEFASNNFTYKSVNDCLIV